MKPPPDDGDGGNPDGDDGLNPMQRAFVLHLTTPGRGFGCATRAAELAGYRSENRDSLKVTACRLLTNANVSRAVERAWAALRDDAEERRRALVTRASVNMGHFLTLNDEGRPVIDWHKAQAAAGLGLIKRLRQQDVKSKTGEVIGLETEIEVYDQMAALELLFKVDGKLRDEGGPGLNVSVTLSPP